jgi:3-oxoacyl-[acyl-carrier protein] reductase
MTMEKRVAIVTGAARGIGASVARRLADDGFTLALADLDESCLKKATEKIQEEVGKDAIAFTVDVSSFRSTQRLSQAVIRQLGRIDVLVNNAGIGGCAASVSDYPVDEWKRVVSVNLDGVFFCCKSVLPQMLAQGSGRIVNISSVAGKEGNPNMAAYSSSKAGVIGFTKSLAKEVATKGIYVNCITPAVIETEILSQLTKDAVNYMVSKIPMGRVGQPEEVAALVAWLASEECTFSTGAVFDISGGRTTY